MEGILVPILVGIVCIVIGISNTKGNLSSIHSYHRHRVSEEDRIIFGRMVGAGTILIGIGMILFGLTAFLSRKLALDWLSAVGGGLLILSVITGLSLSFGAMIKYNKGIF